MRSPHKSILPSSLVLLILISFAITVQARQADKPDVPVVKNGAEPSDGMEVVQLEEMWRAGGEGDDIFFGQIFRAEGDADGNVYLLDAQLCEVPVFSPDGDLIKTLSREGEGPGENQEPVDLTMMPDGTLGIMQRFPGTIVKIDLEGTPVNKIPIGDTTEGGFNQLYTGRCKGAHLMMVAQHATMGDGIQTRTWYVATFDAEGKELHRLWSNDSVIDFSKPVLRELDILDPAMFGSTPGPDGSVYIAPHLDQYSINVFGPDGVLHHVIERDYTPRKRLDLEKNRIQAVFDVWASRNPAGLETEVNQVAMTVSNLYVTDDNHLWVETGHSGLAGPEEAFLTYDVFDPKGRYTKQVALVCDGNYLNDRLFWVADDMVVVVKGAIPAMYATMAGGAAANDEEAGLNEMEVICYRIPG